VTKNTIGLRNEREEGKKDGRNKLVTHIDLSSASVLVLISSSISRSSASVNTDSSLAVVDARPVKAIKNHVIQSEEANTISLMTGGKNKKQVLPK
jgi:DNA polymerase III delta subunit